MLKGVLFYSDSRLTNFQISILHSARQKHKASTLDDRRTGSRLIIFILGGMCYSEMRSAYEVTQSVKSCEVIIGKK